MKKYFTKHRRLFIFKKAPSEFSKALATLSAEDAKATDALYAIQEITSTLQATACSVQATQTAQHAPLREFAVPVRQVTF